MCPVSVCRYSLSLLHAVAGRQEVRAVRNRHVDQGDRDDNQEPLERCNAMSFLPWLHVCCFAELNLPRYKFLVQVVIGEMKGAGVRCVPGRLQRQNLLAERVDLSQDGMPVLVGCLD